jgi:hypothetical protein
MIELGFGGSKGFFGWNPTPKCGSASVADQIYALFRLISKLKTTKGGVFNG